MNCPRCGDNIEEGDRFCSSCGQDLATYRNLWPEAPVVSAPPGHVDSSTLQEVEPGPELPQIPTYLGWASALVAICWPAFWAGIPAVVYAGRAESLIATGDIASAQEAAQKAKTWCWVTFWAGLILWAVALTLVVTL